MKNLITHHGIAILLSILTAFWSQASRAENENIKLPAKKRSNEARAFGVTVENDTKNVGGPGSDQAYSNGLRLSYVYARDHIPFWAPKFVTEHSYLRKALAEAQANFGVGLNHQFFTPNNTQLAQLQRGDRPYAAWLNIAFSVNVKDDFRSQNLELSLGTIGPAAMGESVQNGFHRLIGTDFAQGWGTQINNEPAVQLSYQQRIHFLSFRNGLGPWFDLIPIFGGGLGNVFVGLHSGMIARVGINLPDDFGPARPSSGESTSFVSPTSIAEDPKPSYYLFAGARGNAVARNIFLDGNTFRPSHRVTKYPFTAETEAGVGIQIMPVSLVWRFVVRSPDFEENSGFNSFASVGLTYFTR